MKDVDKMRDTGGTYKSKHLDKPSRDDKKKHKYDEKDPDFNDIKKDPDMKLSSRIAKELIKIAKELME